jgi:hypothetical protein
VPGFTLRRDPIKPAHLIHSDGFLLYLRINSKKLSLTWSAQCRASKEHNMSTPRNPIYDINIFIIKHILHRDRYERARAARLLRQQELLTSKRSAQHVTLPKGY